MSVAIQRIRCNDLGMMRSVLALYAQAFDQPAEYLHNQPDDAYLKDLLSREDFVQIVAVESGRVVGALSGYNLQKFEQARAEFYIYDLAVDEQFRRQGIARALIEALKPVVRQMGAWVIFVQADHGDDPAIALYDSLGMREEVLHFDISLAPD